MSAQDFLPSNRSMDALRNAAQACQGCELHKFGWQTVFGVGSPHAKLVFVGEQPGDVEDKTGLPFTGPAGKLFYQALNDVGIKKEEIYVTNAVKHFYWVPQGKRRLHKKPKVSHIKACLPWLEQEINLIQPLILIGLGTTAGRAILGHPVTLLQYGTKWLVSPFCERTMLLRHPSALLRIPEKEARDRSYQEYLKELTLVRDELILLQHETAS